MDQRQRTVAAFVRSLVIDFHESEDVLQRVAVTLVRRYAQYDPTRSFLAWAMGIAKLEVVMFLHQRRLDRLVFDDALVEQIAESHERARASPRPCLNFSASVWRSWMAAPARQSSCATAGT